MPVKTSANGFFLFMQEFRVREEKRGARFPGGYESIVQPAGEEWEVMSADDKAEYKVCVPTHTYLSKVLGALFIFDNFWFVQKRAQEYKSTADYQHRRNKPPKPKNIDSFIPKFEKPLPRPKMVTDDFEDESNEDFDYVFWYIIT